MTGQQEPEFLTREIVDAIHKDQIDAFGGLHGVRDENALESAMQRPNVITTAAATSMKLQPLMATIWRRVKLISMATREPVFRRQWFLEGCGVDTSRLPEQQTYDLMIRISAHQARPQRLGRLPSFRTGSSNRPD